MTNPFKSEPYSEPIETGTLLNLAERCEKAAGPDQDWLFKDIWRTVFDIGSDAAESRRFLQLIRHNAFLDAAMTLVPEGWTWSAGTTAEDGYEHHTDMDFGWAQVVHRLNGNSIDTDSAATPALALCAAALRARATDGAAA